MNRLIWGPPEQGIVAFTVPPLARVGMLESEALAAGLEVDVKHRSLGSWYSSMRVAEPTSAFKTIVERGTGRIVGAHLLGPGAEEQLNVLMAAMQAKLTARDVKSSASLLTRVSRRTSARCSEHGATSNGMSVSALVSLVRGQWLAHWDARSSARISILSSGISPSHW